MANELIQIGCKIEMKAVDRRTGLTVTGETETYISQLLHWEDTNVATIAVPTQKGHLIPLRVDEVYELQFVTKGGLYCCKGLILKRVKLIGTIATAEVKFISAMEKVQRRQYYRMNCVIGMNYAVLTDGQKELYLKKKRCLSLEQKVEIEKKLEDQKIAFEKAMVLDISGGGMRFNSGVQQEAGEICLLQPALPEALRKKIPYFFGRVISSTRIPNRDPITFDNRVEFVEITSSEQEHIITYIFKEERDKRKREAELK